MQSRRLFSTKPQLIKELSGLIGVTEGGLIKTPKILVDAGLITNKRDR